jgi:hypothetical protein
VFTTRCAADDFGAEDGAAAGAFLVEKSGWHLAPRRETLTFAGRIHDRPVKS